MINSIPNSPIATITATIIAGSSQLVAFLPSPDGLGGAGGVGPTVLLQI